MTIAPVARPGSAGPALLPDTPHLRVARCAFVYKGTLALHLGTGGQPPIASPRKRRCASMTRTSMATPPILPSEVQS